MSASHTSAHTTLSPDPAKAVNEVISIITALHGVYASETEALEKSDIRSFLALQDNKLESARRYQVSIEELLSRREELKNVNPAVRTRLKTMQEEFAGLAKRNLEALERMQKCAGRLGNTIVRAAQETAKKEQALNYGESGTLDDVKKRRVSMGISETA